ncbi:MAG: hypothetical protein ABW167_19560 [Baekduia sp.]
MKLVRGDAKPSDLKDALDQLGVEPGQGFLIANLESSIGEFASGAHGSARPTDPEASHASAEVTLTGEQILAVFECFKLAWPEGMAAFEVVEQTGIRDAWKRVSDLKRGGYIEEKPPPKENPISKRLVAVFVLSARGQLEAGVEELTLAETPPPAEPLLDDSYTPAPPGTATTPFNPYD